MKKVFKFAFVALFLVPFYIFSTLARILARGGSVMLGAGRHRRGGMRRRRF